MKFALFASALFLSSLSVYALEFNQCSERERDLIREGLADSKKSIQQIIHDIDDTLATRRELPKKARKKLVKSKYILKCAEWRTDMLDFDCSEKGYVGYYMKVMPIFGNEVDVASYHLARGGYDFLVGSLIHEATHKCGTNDADYFYQRNQKPHSEWYSEWHNIASTYDYWSIKGFCVPEIDC